MSSSSNTTDPSADTPVTDPTSPGSNDTGDANTTEPIAPEPSPSSPPEQVVAALGLIDQELAFAFVIGCSLFAIFWGFVNTMLVSSTRNN